MVRTGVEQGFLLQSGSPGSIRQSSTLQIPNIISGSILPALPWVNRRGGRILTSHPDTGAYGEYQFIPETRQVILERYGLDAWSTNKAERDQATVALIQAFGDEVGTDIIGLIEAGEFEQADQLLGQHVYSAGGNLIRYGQFTSLPGGAEQHQIWKDPAILAQYGPNGDAGQNPLLAAINTNSQRCNPTLLASANPGPFVEGIWCFNGTVHYSYSWRRIDHK